MAGRDERAPIQIDARQMKKNPLWNHVVLLERAGTGGNARWRCKYCGEEYGGSYSRVKSHLLRVQGGGIKICAKVTKSVLSQLNSEVAKAKEDAICCYVIYYYCVCLFGTMISVIYDL